MNVLDKLQGGKLDMKIIKVCSWGCQIDENAENELLRLAKIGAEAEKLSKKCLDKDDTCHNSCLSGSLCKLVKEGAK